MVGGYGCLFIDLVYWVWGVPGIFLFELYISLPPPLGHRISSRLLQLQRCCSRSTQDLQVNGRLDEKRRIRTPMTYRVDSFTVSLRTSSPSSHFFIVCRGKVI